MFNKKNIFSPKPLKFKIIFLYSFLIFFIIACWTILFYFSYNDIQFLSLGLLAFLLGLKHAMDADHITAIDNVTRKLVNDGKKQVGVGLFFSLGHSTIVLIMAIIFVISASFISANLSWFGHVGIILGTSVSALFLYIIALMNISVLISIIKTYRDIKIKKASDKEIEEEMSKLGFMNRFFKKFYNSINSSYQMYPVGVLFGLGFDTATEVLLLGITVSAALNEKSILVVLILPFLFASGMMFLDSTDSVIMLFAYKWAFINPIRKIKYNISLTTLSVVLALLIGTIEWFQVLALEAGYKKGFIGALLHLSFSAIGAAIAVLFIVIWGVYILINKAGLVNQDRQ